MGSLENARGDMTLVSKDGKKIVVPKCWLKHSKTLTRMNEVHGDSDHEAPLKEYSGSVLVLVVEWSEFHKDDPMQKDDDGDHRERRSDDISEWDNKFIDKMDMSTIIELVKAANYLDMAPLMDTLCKCIANKMKGKSPEELRSMLNIDFDLTAQDQAEIAQDGVWSRE